jgi:hypothetical protein
MLTVDRKLVKEYVLVALAFLLISLVFFWPLLSNITQVVPGVGGDTFQSMWNLWWVPYSLFTLGSSPYVTHMVFYPVGANLATQTMAPIAGIVSLLFQWVSLAFSLNMIFLIGFALSGLFMYMLAFHITKNRIASFIAGFIFAFSPIHTVQSFGHLQFMNIGFIPLFLLFFIKMFEEHRHRDAILAGVSFVLLTFMGDIEQALMTMVIAFLILVYLALTKSNRPKVLNRKFALSLAEMVVVAAAVGSPGILAIAGSLNQATLSTVNAQASLGYNMLYSPDLLSFFIPSSMNGILSSISSQFASINAPAVAERTTYAGYTVILLALIGIWASFKEKFKHYTGMIVFALVVLALLSVGPYLQVNGSATQVPGLYLAYHQIPLFNVLREPGRFDMAVELFLALLAAIGFAEVEKKLAGSKPGGRDLRLVVAVVFLALLVVEYNPLPVSASALNGMYTSAQIPSAYPEIGLVPGNFSVLVLPALPNQANATPELYPGLALYYQTAFKKALVGGYTTRSNVSQAFSLVNIPLVDGAAYLGNGQGLIYGSPIIENYTNATLLMLYAYNVEFISMIRQAYNASQTQSLASYLASVFGYPVYQSNSTLVFSTANAIGRSVGRSVVAYTPVLMGSQYSIWQPGWVLCGLTPCVAAVANTWYAVDPAYINIYSPKQAAVSMSMRAMSPTGPKTEYIYFNNQPLYALNLTTSLKNYTLNMSTLTGLNQLIFYSQGGNSTAYSNIGVQNITFRSR